MEELLKKGNLIFFGGKGGTGKTTCSAATGYHAAKKGLKTIVISVDNKEHSLGNSFDLDIGDGIYKVNEHLDVYELNATKLMEDYTSQNKDVEDILGAFFGEQSFNIAGSAEVLGLYEIHRIKNLKKKDAKTGKEDYLYDLVIVDTAPTASALGLLETVRAVEGLLENKKFWKVVDTVIPWVKRFKSAYGTMDGIKKGWDKMWGKKEDEDEEWAKMFNEGIEKKLKNFDTDNVKDYMTQFKETLGGVRELLENKEQTKFNIVGNPEQMSVNESISLSNRLDEIQMPKGYMIFNRVQTPTDKDHKGSCECHDFLESQYKAQQPHIKFFDSIVNENGVPNTEGSAYMESIVQEYKGKFSGKQKMGIIQVPRSSKDIHGKEALEWVESYIFNKK